MKRVIALCLFVMMMLGLTACDKTASPAVIVDEETAPIEKGSVINFGTYEQDNDLSNGAEPIVWHVLNVDGDEAMLLCEKALIGKPYYLEDENGAATFDIYNWLHNDFLNSAFSQDEKQSLVEIPGITESYVTLPDFSLAKSFLDSNDPLGICIATKYASANGCGYNQPDNRTAYWLNNGWMADSTQIGLTSESYTFGIRPVIYIKL